MNIETLRRRAQKKREKENATRKPEKIQEESNKYGKRPYGKKYGK